MYSRYIHTNNLPFNFICMAHEIRLLYCAPLASFIIFTPAFMRPFSPYKAGLILRREFYFNGVSMNEVKREHNEIE